MICYPTSSPSPSTLGVFLFIGGLSGEIPAELYSEYLQNVASYGMIAIGFDMFDPEGQTKYFLEGMPRWRSAL